MPLAEQVPPPWGESPCTGDPGADAVAEGWCGGRGLTGGSTVPRSTFPGPPWGGLLTGGGTQDRVWLAQEVHLSGQHIQRGQVQVSG